MIIDMKYHIASLVAVFLALGIGILLGSAVLGNNVNEAVVQQQKQMVENLQNDFAQIRKENQAAQAELETYKENLNYSKWFEAAVLPVLVQGRLQDKKIAFIDTSNYGYHEDWIDILKTAGAQISSLTTVQEGFDLKNEQVRNTLATKLLLNDADETTILRALATEIAVGIISAQNIENLHYLAQQGLITNSGEYGVPIDAVIIIGGSETESGQRCVDLDVPLIDYLTEQKITVIGVETSDVAYSYMKAYQKEKISTVDNIDQLAGQAALVFALTGKSGNYGIKSTAKQLMPLLP